MAILVLATSTAWTGANVATARAARTTQELCTVAIRARDGPGIPSSALGVLRHGVIEALGPATLAALSLARVATAFAPMATCETVLHAVAAHIARSHTNVATARASCSALEIVPVRVGAGDRVTCARSALCHWVLVASLPLVAALAPGRCARVSTASPTVLAREEIPIVVPATAVAFCLTDISTTLSIAAWKWKSVAVHTHVHAKLVEPLRKVPLGGPHCQEGALIQVALAVGAGVCSSMCRNLDCQGQRRCHQTAECHLARFWVLCHFCEANRAKMP